MRRTAALLAVVSTLALMSCGGDDAEPGAPKGDASVSASRDSVSLILDFQPNAVHVGLYSAVAGAAGRHRGGIGLEILEPGDSTDAPKLLRSGRVDYAVLDIHDLAIAREAGFDLVGVAPIVQRPLAAVITTNPNEIKRPRDLEGRTVGVTGLPSDDAVLESVLQADGADPERVERVTIGFDSVAALGAEQVDAATAFWNAEGASLRELGIPTREFRVNHFGAPGYPELVVATTRDTVETRPDEVDALREVVVDGYGTIRGQTKAALKVMHSAVPSLDRRTLKLQLNALGEALAPAPLDRETLQAWADWDLRHGIVEEPIDVDQAFDFPTG